MSAPARCVICRHKKAKEITEELLSGGSVRKTAIKYGVSPSSVQKHRTVCMSRDYEALINAAEKQVRLAKANEKLAIEKVKEPEILSVLSGVAIVEKINDIVYDAENIKNMALDDNKLSVANQALQTKLKAIDSYAKMAAEAREREKMKEESMKKDWLSLREVIRRVLARYPGASEEFEKELQNELSGRRSTIFS